MMHIHVVPSFFFSNKIGAFQRDTLDLMNFLSNNSYSCSFNSLSSVKAILFEAFKIGLVPGTKFITNCIS